MRRIIANLLVLLLVFSLTSINGSAKETDKQHDKELWNVVHPLSTTVTFLNTGAHPDDERSDFLAYLSRGLGVKTTSLIANRGEGGQNEIGDELGNALGIIRSNEMIESAKITDVKAFHLSRTTSDTIYDFGFSKSPEETLDKWGENVTYERLIRFIRTQQPDIVMPSFRNVDSQHGHHRAISLLTERAFEDAANPNVYPEQLENGLSTWQIKKMYLPAASKDTASTSIEIGDYDPIYEMTYPQLGEASRYMHKSQGMGNDIPAEPRQIHLELIKSVEDNNTELFDGIAYDFNDWAKRISKKNISNHLKKLQNDLDSIIQEYPNRESIFVKSQQLLKTVERIINKTKRTEFDTSMKRDLLHKLELKKEQLQKVIFTASNLQIKTRAASSIVTQGEQSSITMELTNKGKKTLKKINADLLLPKDWVNVNSKQIKSLKPNESKTIIFDYEVPKNAGYFQPYEEPIIKTKVSMNGKGTKATAIEELPETLAILPELSVTTNPTNIVVNTADVQDKIPVTITVKNYSSGKRKGSVSLNLPKGWNSEPKQSNISFEERYDEKEVTFNLIPPSKIEEGSLSIEAKVNSSGKTYQTAVQEIQYDHIKDSYYQYPSMINAEAFKLLKPDNLKIGYIESGFDKVADYLIETGFDVTTLKEEDLSSGDLSQFDTIITGIRANLSRTDLVTNNQRLLQYVEDGGHLVVQYHKPGDNWDTQNSAPYQLKIGSPSIEWRVTDENAVVNILKPEHKLFNYPNTITENDWQNWVQERGLYFPMSWDSNFETFVSMSDPNEDPFTSGILMAEYGKGTYLYTNLVFYRQIDNQVPGGYRIFTNLISYGVNE
ncbi:NEW3 domain-containing protein [Virgibacillus sp. AGTR]|uniref:PIG-L family deacetylase n=1 Tax=unclassified Virgibacillus TaxID=2620237 RepID=UPI001963F808|nr:MULTISPECIES: PIG-L family deacetylase [unclassified Virgibacillus]MCC2251407.1 NEW3 domain-containing protein [Virgibacillus sp. AGTR]MDY7042780.1 NEW3 domain-containing protein [Virgibacillus sp. M23]QRZ18115.1 PIG-L family deacetylase [Virgibacillus sp. AGTR]